MLTTGELVATIGRITYRPGWALTVYRDDGSGLDVLHVRCSVPDARRDGENTVLSIRSPIPDGEKRTVHDFICYVQWRLRIIEIHESQEWMRVDGAIWADPHLSPH